LSLAGTAAIDFETEHLGKALINSIP
jgi:hypothetical protein